MIFGTSCTYIPSKQFVHGVVNATGGHISKNSFNGFWASWWWVFVKGYHVLEYFLLTLLFARSLRLIGRFSGFRSIAVSLAFSICYAASDEYHQTFVPGRGGRISDVMIDTIGVSLASAILIVASLSNRDRARMGT